jgi:hypothetical protein
VRWSLLIAMLLVGMPLIAVQQDASATSASASNLHGSGSPLDAVVSEAMGQSAPIALQDGVVEGVSARLAADRADRLATLQVGAQQGRPSDYPFAVASIEALIDYDAVNDQVLDVWPISLCSGAMVSPTVVLTAGHCSSDPVQQIYLGGGEYLIQTYVIIQGSSDLGTSGGTVQVSLAVAAVTAGYTGDFPSFDAGFIRLPEAFPINLPDYPLVEGIQVPLSPADDELAHHALTLVSYGSSDIDPTAVGKMQVGRYDVLDAGVCTTAFGPVSVPAHALCLTGRRPTVDACNGDSGGPILDARFGTRVIVAVVSAGSSSCSTAPGFFAARLGPIFADALGHGREETAVGDLDVDAPGFGGSANVVGALGGGGQFILATGPVGPLLKNAALWTAGHGSKPVKATVVPGGLAIKVADVAAGIPLLLEVPTLGPSGFAMRYFTFTAEMRQPTLEVTATQDAKGAPIILGHAVDGDGAAIPKLAITGTIEGGPKTTKVMATTMKDGSFILKLVGLGPGNYTFHAHAQPAPALLQDGLDEAHSFSLANRVPHLGNATQGVDPKGLPTLTGTVRDQAGARLAKLPVTGTIHVGTKDRTVLGTSAADGSLLLKLGPLPAGTYSLHLVSKPAPAMLVTALDETVPVTIT